MFRPLALAWLVAVAVAPAASAHSVKDLEALMGDKEKFFQPIDKPTPGFALRDADGKPAKLVDLRGKVVVLHFIYAGCPDICPLHAEKIAEVQAMVNRTPMKEQVRFITITTDPSNDTPDILRAYGPTHGLDPANWAFLTTAPDQPEDGTRKLAEAYGHKFIKIESGYQVHSVVTHVIDKDGRWRANFYGLRFQPLNLVMFVNALVNDHDHEEEQPGFWGRLRALF